MPLRYRLSSLACCKPFPLLFSAQLSPHLHPHPHVTSLAARGPTFFRFSLSGRSRSWRALAEETNPTPPWQPQSYFLSCLLSWFVNRIPLRNIVNLDFAVSTACLMLQNLHRLPPPPRSISLASRTEAERFPIWIPGLLGMQSSYSCTRYTQPRPSRLFMPMACANFSVDRWLDRIPRWLYASEIAHVRELTQACLSLLL